ncbi:MAG: type II secretion system F family protein [Thermoguttaceae bacterium]
MSDDRNKDAEPRAKLSADEATELASQVASLAKAGLPLESGLRALADELPGGRLPQALREISRRLQGGASLESAIKAMGPRFPAHVRGLILAGTRSGQLAEVLEEFVDLHRSQEELRWRVWLAVAYPLLLLAMLSGLAVLADRFIVDEFVRIFDDFDAELPVMTQAVITLSGPCSWLMVAATAGLAGIVLLLTTPIPGLSLLRRPLYAIPVIGPLWRFNRWSQCCRLVGMLVRLKAPLPEVFRLTATAVGDPYLAKRCRDVANDLEAGHSLAKSLMSRRRFPLTMIPLIEWGQRTDALPEAFEATAEMLEGRAETQAGLLTAMLLPITLLILITSVGLFMVAMFMPLISLIQNLT